MGRTSVPSKRVTRRRSIAKSVTRNSRASSIQQILPKIIDSIEIQETSDSESDLTELETNQHVYSLRSSRADKIIPKIIDSIEIQETSDSESDLTDIESNHQSKYLRTSSTSKVIPKTIDSIEIQETSDSESDLTEVETNQHGYYLRSSRNRKGPSKRFKKRGDFTKDRGDFINLTDDFDGDHLSKETSFETIIVVDGDDDDICMSNVGPVSKSNETIPISNFSSQSKSNETILMSNVGPVSRSNEAIPISNFSSQSKSNETILTSNVGPVSRSNEAIPNSNFSSQSKSNETVPISNVGRVSKSNKTIPMINVGPVSKSNETIPISNVISNPKNHETIPVSNVGPVSKSNEAIPIGNVSSQSKSNEPMPMETLADSQNIAPSISLAANVNDVNLLRYSQPFSQSIQKELADIAYNYRGISAPNAHSLYLENSHSTTVHRSGLESVGIDCNANKIDPKPMIAILHPTKPPSEVKKLNNTKKRKKRKKKSKLLLDDVNLLPYFIPLSSILKRLTDADPKPVTAILHPTKPLIEVKRLNNTKKKKKRKKKSKHLLNDVNLLPYFQPLSSIQNRITDIAYNYKGISAPGAHSSYLENSHSTTVHRSETNDENLNTIPDTGNDKIIDGSKNVKQVIVATVHRSKTTDANLNTIPDTGNDKNIDGSKNVKQVIVATVNCNKTTDANLKTIPAFRTEKIIDGPKNVKQVVVSTVLRSKTTDGNLNTIPDLRTEKIIEGSKNSKQVVVATVLRDKTNDANLSTILDLTTEKIIDVSKNVKQEIVAESENIFHNDTSEASKDSIRLDVGSNVFVPNGVTFKGRRPIIIDGSNVAYRHGVRRQGGPVFSSRGIEICAQYFRKRGHKVIAFVPTYRRHHPQTRNPEILQRLAVQGLVTFTPSQETRFKRWVSYDDRFIIQCAVALGGVIVSNDRYRDLYGENPTWKNTIENRVLMFTFVGDELILRQDPLRARGIELEQFLRFPGKAEIV